MFKLARFMKNTTPIEHGRYYHIYNRGNNSQKIFKDSDDYKHFFDLMMVYIYPVSEIYSYALMGNHFHFVLRVKDENEIGYLNPQYAKSEDLHLKWKTYFPKTEIEKEENNLEKKPVPERMFQHFFIAYAKEFNEKYERTGSLFEYKFKRILIENENYLKRLIMYINNNPVEHRICEKTEEYPYTSYLSLISNKPTKLARQFVIGLFGDLTNFIFVHGIDDDVSDIEDLLLE